MVKIKPTKIIGLGYAFKDSYPEKCYPTEPVIFLKGTNTIVYNGDNVIYPKNVSKVWMEGELAIVMGENNTIKGYTISNDITAENLYERDHHLARSKSFNTFCPIGPKIVNDIDANNLQIMSFLNDNLIQHYNTNNRIYTNEEIVSMISEIMTLYPDDIILTGTHPLNIMTNGVLHKGDIMRIQIDEIGILENKVI